MEREYTVGALLVLVTIFVIALIVYFTVPEFSTSVKQIADEVFGISSQLSKKAGEDLQKKEAIKVFENVKKCINNLKSKDKKCTCYLENTELPEGYIIRTEEDGESQFLKLEKDRVKVENTERLPLEGLEFFILKQDLTPEIVPLQVFVIKSFNGKLRLNEKEFIEDTPAFYNCIQDGKKKICFVTEEVNEEAAKKIRKFNDCEKIEENIAENGMLNVFNSFIVKYERCKSLKGKNNCLCDQVDFKELLDGYEIFANQDAVKKETNFSLYYTEDGKPTLVGKEKGSKTIKDSIFGFDYKTLLHGEIGYLKEWQLKVEGNIVWEYIKSIFKGKIERIPFIFKGEEDEIFLISKIKPENIEKCAPEYITISGKGCRLITNKEIISMHKRLVGGDSEYRYGGKAYKQIIEEQVKDPNMRLLISSIIAVESGFNNKAINMNKKSGKIVSVDKGIMQFNDGTAPGYGACHPKGCNIPGGDYREDPYISIKAAEKLLNDNLKSFGGKTYQEVFAIAAYNTGSGNVGKAIQKTGKKDPSWDEIRVYLSDITKCYPYKVETYKKAFEQEFTTGTT